MSKNKETEQNQDLEGMSYEAAKEELGELIKKIESREVNIDELSDILKRSKFLLNHCTEKLTSTNDEIEEIIEE